VSALLISVAAGALGWLFYTEPGLRWALARAESAAGGRLAVEGVGGALARAVIAQRIVYDADSLKVELKGVSGRVHLAAALGGRIVIEPLHVDSAELVLREGGKPPSDAPLLAYGVHLGEVEIARLRIVRADTLHELRALRVAHFSLGAGRSGPLSGEASFDLAHERYPLHAALKLGGTLERTTASSTVDLEKATVHAQGVFAPFQRQPLVSLEALARGVDLARFGELPRTDLTVTLKAVGGISGTLAVANAAAGPLDEDRLPVASLETRFRSSDLASAELDGTRLAIAGGGVLEGGGRVSAAGVDAALNVTGLNLRALRSDLRQTALAGVLRFELAREAQMLRGTLAQAGMSVSAEAVRKGDTVEIASLHAAAGRGEVSGAGTVKLAEPLAFDARLTLARFDPAAFGDYPEGALSGKVDAQGHLGDAPRVELRWALAESTLLDRPFASRGEARVEDQRVSRADAEVTLGESRASARGSFGAAGDHLAVTLLVPEVSEYLPDLAGRLEASGTLSGKWTLPEASLEAKLDAPAFRRFKARAASLSATGTLERHEARLHLSTDDAEVDARLRGGLKEGASWSGEIAALEVSGAVPLTLNAPAPLRAPRSSVELGRFEASLGEAKLLVRELAWSRARVASSGEFSGLPAQWLVAFAGLTERVRSTLLLDAQWSLTAGDKVDGSLRLRRSGGDLALVAEQPFQLGLESLALDARFTPAGVGARMDVVSRAASGALTGQLGRDATAGPVGIGPDSALLLQGQLELAGARVLARQFQGEARIDGHLVANLDVRGTLGTPRLGGVVRGRALAFEVPTWGVYLKNGALRAALDGDTLQVESFSVSGGEGTFSASGSLPLRLADGNANLAWQARNFAFVQRQDLRLIASGEGSAAFDGKRLSLSGALRAERGYVEIDRDRIPKLGDDVVIKGQEAQPVRAKAQLPLALDVDLDLGSRLDIRMYGVEGRLGGRVNVATSKEGELRAYGELRTINATFFAYGQKLQVDPGIVIFDGPIDNPSLQITAWRRNLQVEPGVQVTGTVRAPRVQLVSQPPVSEGERLSWLVLGRAPTDATKADLGLLQAAAGALLARGDTMPLDRRLARSFGLDEVSFRGSGEVQDRVLAFGKRFSDRLYVTYEQGLGTVVSNLVKMDYSLSRRWSVRAETGTSSGGGLFYRFSWD